MVDESVIRQECDRRGYEFIECCRIKRHIYIKYVCSKHKDVGIVKIRIDSFIKGSGCKMCAIERNKKLRSSTLEQYIEQVYNATQNEYRVISDNYVNANTKVIMQHMICDNKYEITPAHFLEGQRCPYCQGLRKTTEDFYKEVQELGFGEYELIGEYKNARTKTQIKHITCGNIHNVTPNKFLNGIRCPKCVTPNNSKLSQSIERFLLDNNIVYKREYVLEDCKHIHVLHFDFAIFIDNKLHCLIEADGEYHYKVKCNDIKRYENTQLCDKTKNEYCAINNIKLVRIPYYEIKNVEKILTELILPN